MSADRMMTWLALLLAGAVQAGTIPDAEWSTADRPDWDAAALEALFDYAREQQSTGVVMVHEGELIAERHWPAIKTERYQRMLHGTTADGRTLEDVASVQKSVISFLIGIARSRGLLGLDQSVSDHLGGGWSNAPAEAERAITIRHLLTMSSGLDPALTREAVAGRKWRYNTRAYSKLVKVLEAAAGTDINRLTRNWLTGPLKMTESDWRPRPWVTDDLDANAIGFVTSARDLARFGVLMLNEGAWGSTDLLGDPDYFAESIRPSQTMNPAYGYLWWLNGAPARSARGQTHSTLAPSAPSDLYAAQGALGRKLFVVPSLDLAVTRLGDQPAQDFNHQFWRRLMAAIPAQTICDRCDAPFGSPDVPHN